MVRRSPRQLSSQDHRKHTGHGGPREGAGRPTLSPRPPVHHVHRPGVPRGCPAHVTLRVRRGVPSLRRRGFVREFRRSLALACERGEFRVCHYSIQRDHVHFIVEAAGKEALGRGMKSVGARLARAANRVFKSSGPVLYGRYHLQILRAPRQVRNAIAYVLLNARKHSRQRTGAAPPVRLDEASSGGTFEGWRRSPPGEATPGRGVARPRSWLLKTGWRRHGLIDPMEVPGTAR